MPTTGFGHRLGLCGIWQDRSNLAFSALSFKQYLHLNNYEYGLGSGAHLLRTKLGPFSGTPLPAQSC